MGVEGWGRQGDLGRSSGLASPGFEGGAQGLPGGKMEVGRGMWGDVSSTREIETIVYDNLERMGFELAMGHSVIPGPRKVALADGEDREERNEPPGFDFSAMSGDVGVPSNRRVGDLGDGHDNGRLGGGGKGGEELKLSHKEVIDMLKSTLQAAGTVRKKGKWRMNPVGLLERLVTIHYY